MFPTQEHIQAAQEAADYWKAKTGHYAWPSVALGQADDESAGWTKLAARNNGFGVTATPAQIAAGKAAYVWTKEWDAKLGKLVPKQRYFAAYDSLKEAYLEHARILTTVSLYKDAWSQPDADSFLAHIAPHYASAPKYAGIVRGYMKRMNAYQYDRPAAVAPPPALPPVPAAVGGAAGAGAVIVATAAQHLPGLGWQPFAALAVVGLISAAVYMAHRRKLERLYAEALTAPTVEPPPRPAIVPPAPEPPATVAQFVGARS